MSRSVFDKFIYYDPSDDRIIVIHRDVAFDGIWEYFHYDGEAAWWTNGLLVLDHWVLLDRWPG